MRGGPPTTGHGLPKIRDRLSFVYLERSVVHREGNALTSTDERGTIHIPTATLNTLLLGPGTRITYAAICLLGDCKVTTLWVGEKGIRYYSHGRGPGTSARYLIRQAELVSDTKKRLAVARAMYGMRFDDDTAGLSMEQLRGREGARVRKIYRNESRRTGVEWSKREYDPDNFENSDDINKALSAANACLYGVVHAVIVALGASPGLGFIHTGHDRAFVYDIADLYKAQLSIPIAFDAVANNSPDITADIRVRMRDAFSDLKIINTIVADITHLFFQNDEVENALEDLNLADSVIHLWDEESGSTIGGRSW